MNHEKDWEFEQTLAESEMILKSAAKSARDDLDYSLESILAEFSSNDEAKKNIVPPPTVTVSEETLETAQEAPDASPSFVDVSNAKPEKEEADLSYSLDKMFGPAPRGVSLQEVLKTTVESVLEEEEDILLPDKPRRRWLFSRKRMQDTEQLYDKAESETPHAEEEPDDEEDFFFEDFGAPGTEEPPIEETLAEYRELSVYHRKVGIACSVITALMWGLLLLEHTTLLPALYYEEPLLYRLPPLVALLLMCLLGRDVFVYGFEQVIKGKFTYELVTSLSCLAAIADTAMMFFLPERTAFAAQPFPTVAALQMLVALWGRSLLFSALYNTVRVAAVEDPSYLVTITIGGAAKRRGSADLFTICAQQDDCATRWQAVLLPVLCAAAFTFAGLATAENGNWYLFAWNLCVMFSGINMLSFPLIYAFPFYRLSRRFVKSGSALAGYVGAKRIKASNCVILTDTDLFPPGTLSLNGLKIYGEESGKVISYAATMAHAAQSGLSSLLDPLLQSEGGSLQILDNLNFYEEGGVSGLIRGESVLFGTAAFCRKMGVLLPSGLTLKTGVFLAVDRTLIAIFAVKYTAAENVDWALHALRRNRITPVLAVRDGNITPALLKRKFGTDAKAIYPTVSTRLALSEKNGDHPYALLYREGLMPYAEVAVGSKRLVHAVHSGTAISLICSSISALLAFYLTYVGAWHLLTPLSMFMYSILLSLAAVLDGIFVDRY